MERLYVTEVAIIYRGPFKINGCIYDSSYCVKIIHDDFDVEQYRQYIDKETIASNLLNCETAISHRDSWDNHICCVKKIYTSPTKIFLLQPYGGETLFDLTDKSLVTVRDYVEGFKQLLKAIKFLISCKIVHFDIKSNNVTLLPSKNSATHYNFYLIDFDNSINKHELHEDNKYIQDISKKLENYPRYPKVCRDPKTFVENWDRIDLHLLCQMSIEVSKDLTGRHVGEGPVLYKKFMSMVIHKDNYLPALDEVYDSFMQL